MTLVSLRNLTLLSLAATMLLAAGARAADKVTVFDGRDLDGWKLRNSSITNTWKAVAEVKLDPTNSRKLAGEGEGKAGTGILFRQPVEHGTDIITTKQFGDCALHIEFMVPRGSNSGVYLMGEYEVQVLDSYGKPDNQLSQGDVGAIYSASKPLTNAAKKPGEWQTFDIVFRAPRFDAKGQKMVNARFESVKLNGVEVQKDIEVKGPTGGQLGGEKATGPLMLQGDHGIVAFRNIYYTPLD